MESDQIHAIWYTDGSCKGNPGYSGYGDYGYTFKFKTKAKNIKHPANDKQYYTPTGISTNKGDIAIEVIDIYESIIAINNPNSTNNEAELAAVVTAMEKILLIDNLASAKIFTDSNYIVSCYNENLDKWISNNWLRTDNKPIVHRKEWEIIYNLRNSLRSKNISLEISWVKGHSEDYGNNICDLYSVIASNASRQLTDNDNFTLVDMVNSYSDYKKSFGGIDFIFSFRDLYFSSDYINDNSYCFLSTSETSETIGKKDNTSIFASNIGYVPDLINNIKSFFRKINRSYTTICCVKLSKLKSKEVFRISKYLKIDYLLVKSSYLNTYNIIGDNTSFLFEAGSNYPFIIDAVNLFDSLGIANEDNIVIDITDKLLDSSTNKLSITNKVNMIDLTDKLDSASSIRLKSKLLIKLGYDLPNYIALKQIESDILKINLIIETKPDSNLCVIYVHIKTNDREIYTTNMFPKLKIDIGSSRDSNY